MAASVADGLVTAASQMRSLLAQAEKRVVAPSDGGGAPELYGWLDEIAAMWPALEASGSDVRAEAARWESLQGQVTTRAGAILKAWNRAGGLPAARTAAAPDRANWWWWLDEQTSAQRSRRFVRAAIIAVVVVGVLALGSQMLRILLPVDPVVRDVYTFREDARSAFESGDVAGALASYQQAVERSPDDPQLRLMVGVLAEQLGQTDLASESFAAARSAVNDDGWYYIERGFGYLEVQDLQRALADGLQAVASKPDDGRAWMLVGTAREGMGDPVGALDAYTQASEVASDSDPEITAIARMRMAGLMQSLQGMPPITPTP